MKKIALLLAAIVVGIATRAAEHPFAAGDGTESNPYQITTPAQLDAVRNYLDKHFILKADLDLSEDYPLWLPIGKDEEGSANNFTVFSGSLDGDGHVVTGVNIIWSGNYSGLFAVVSGRIANLGVKGNINNPVGGGCGLIVGYLGQNGSPGEIADCFAEGTVQTGEGGSNNIGVGLLLGNLTYGSRLTGCYAKGAVIAATSQYVGGLVGRVQQNTCSLFDSYAETSVSGTTNVGGICGRLYSATDENAAFLYATGSVMGQDFVGGIAGDFYNAKGSCMIAANPSVRATGANANVARVAPIAPSGQAIALDNIFALSTMTLQKGGQDATIENNIAGKDGLSKPLAELQSAAFYEELGWDLDATWQLPADGFPTLRWQENMPSAILKTLSEAAFFTFMQGKMLHIRNIVPGSVIAVYTAGGQPVAKRQSAGASDVVILPQKGLYILNVQSGNDRYSDKIVCE